MRHGLSKKERICSVGAIEVLLRQGKYAASGPLRCCFVKREQPLEGDINRIMLSVSKKYFKRAVKRNLMKRRIREAYRLQKELLPADNIDLMFIYSSKELSDFQTISESVRQLLENVCARTSAK